jgi:hypothetical protein
VFDERIKRNDTEMMSVWGMIVEEKDIVLLRKLFDAILESGTVFTIDEVLADVVFCMNEMQVK